MRKKHLVITFWKEDKLTCASCALAHEVTPCGTGGQHSQHACTWCPTWWDTARGQKAHERHYQFKPRKFGAASSTAKQGAKHKLSLFYEKFKKKVNCEGTLVDFVVEFSYLGCMLAGSGLPLADVLYRLEGASHTWIKMRRVLCNKALDLDIRIGLYKVCICSTLRYSSDAWAFTDAAKKRVNDFNWKRLAAITGFSAENMAIDPPFCLVTSIWRTRVIWIGHILRYPEGCRAREVLLAYLQAFETPEGEFMTYPEGSLMEDAPAHREIGELITFATGDGTEGGKKSGRMRWKLHVATVCYSGESRWSSDNGPITVDVIK